MSDKPCVLDRTEIIIGDKTYTLVLGFNALLELQQELGLTIQQATELVKRDPMGYGLKFYRTVLWAALDDEDLTLRETGRMLDKVPGKNFTERMAYLSEILKKLFAQIGDADSKTTEITDKTELKNSESGVKKADSTGK